MPLHVDIQPVLVADQLVEHSMVWQDSAPDREVRGIGDFSAHMVLRFGADLSNT